MHCCKIVWNQCTNELLIKGILAYKDSSLQFLLLSNLYLLIQHSMLIPLNLHCQLTLLASRQFFPNLLTVTLACAWEFIVVCNAPSSVIITDTHSTQWKQTIWHRCEITDLTKRDSHTSLFFFYSLAVTPSSPNSFLFSTQIFHNFHFSHSLWTTPFNLPLYFVSLCLLFTSTLKSQFPKCRWSND